MALYDGGGIQVSPQVQERCWEGGKEDGNGEVLTAKVRGFVWLLIASVLDVDISDQRCASV